MGIRFNAKPSRVFRVGDIRETHGKMVVKL
jgi:hypothetical protein